MISAHQENIIHKNIFKDGENNNMNIEENNNNSHLQESPNFFRNNTIGMNINRINQTQNNIPNPFNMNNNILLI